MTHRSLPRTLFIRVFAVFFCAGLLILASTARAQNLVQNSSVESTLAPWAWEAAPSAAPSTQPGATPPAPLATCVSDSDVKHWEGQSLRLGATRAADGRPAGKLAQTINGLAPGKNYHVMLWCRGNEASAKNQIVVGSKGQFHADLPGGTFDWRRIDFDFTADAPSLPLAILVQDKTTAVWIDDVYLTAAPFASAQELSIANDGTTDVTAALTAALKTHRFIYFPAGTYLLSAPVNVPSDTILFGDGASTILKQKSPDAAAMFSGTSTDTYRLKDIEVSAMRFEGLPGRQMKVQQFALSFATIEGLTVRNCSAQYCGLVSTGIYKGGYGDIKNEELLSKRIRVVHSDIQGTAADFGPMGILISYTVDADLSDNNIQFYGHGIQWWGGDSNLGRDGPYNNPRWVRRVRVDHNTIAHVGGGGIWGSNGANITITHNFVDTCGDVGIDFEGCFDSVADSNTVKDGANGALSSFFAAKNLTFSNNDVITTNPGWSVFRLYNSSQDPSNIHNIVLKNNRFVATTGIGNFTDFMGPGEMKLIDNTFTNVVIDISRGDGGFNEVGPVIDGNTLLFDRDVPARVVGIKAIFSFGNASVINNTVRYTGPSRSNKVGMIVRKAFSQPAELDVSNNKVEGFGEVGIAVSSVPGAVAIIENNTVDGAPITVDTTTGMRVIAGHNKNQAGTSLELTEASSPHG